MMTTLNKIADLTDPRAIAAEFKKLPPKEAIAVAFQCAIDWVDDGDFMEQIMSALGVHRQIQDNLKFFHSMSDKKLLECLNNPFLSTEAIAWAALYQCRYFASINNYKRIGAIANLALKQLGKKEC